MEGTYFDSREDVIQFAQGQLRGSMIPHDEFDERVEELAELIVSQETFYYAQDCTEILEALWAKGNGFWPIGENEE